jgi:ribonuclease VapC
LTEVEYITIQEEGTFIATIRLDDLAKLPIQWIHSDRALCGESAKLKAKHKISFADSFVAATAMRLNATLVHRDPEFGALAPDLRRTMLPPK